MLLFNFIILWKSEWSKLFLEIAFDNIEKQALNFVNLFFSLVYIFQQE